MCGCVCVWVCVVVCVCVCVGLCVCDAFITLVENPLARGLPSKVGGHGVNKPLACSRRFINTRPPTLLDRPLARGFSTNVVKPLQVKDIKEPSCAAVAVAAGCTAACAAGAAAVAAGVVAVEPRPKTKQQRPETERQR